MSISLDFTIIYMHALKEMLFLKENNETSFEFESHFTFECHFSPKDIPLFDYSISIDLGAVCFLIFC